MNQLKDSILEVVKDDNYDLSDLQEVLNPITRFIDNPVFMNHLKLITGVVLEDRDGNNEFTLNDLKLLSKDITAASSLISALLLALGSIQKTVLKFDKDALEELVFKLLSYIFLVVIPTETGSSLTFQEKDEIMALVLNIYLLIKSTQVTQDLINKVSNWFNKKGWCKCCCGTQSSIEVVEENMPRLQAEIRTSVQKNKEITKLNREVQRLQEQIADLDFIQVDVVPTDKCLDVEATTCVDKCESTEIACEDKCESTEAACGDKCESTEAACEVKTV